MANRPRGRFDSRILTSLETRFQRRFGRPLPLSALGMTLTHATMNYDHSGRGSGSEATEAPRTPRKGADKNA